jgi:hypothetical protein
MMKPKAVLPGQVWIWHPKVPKPGPDKPVTVSQLTIPTPSHGMATVRALCLEEGRNPDRTLKVDPDGANLVHFLESPGVQVDRILLSSDEWEYLRG